MGRGRPTVAVRCAVDEDSWVLRSDSEARHLCRCLRVIAGLRQGLAVDTRLPSNFTAALGGAAGPEPSSAPAMLSPENLLEAFASNLASLPRLPPPIQVFPSSCAILLYLNSSSNLSHCMPRSSFPGAICLPDLVSPPFPRGGGRLWGPLMAGPTHSDESSSSVELMHQFDAILRKPFPPGERASRISRGLWACTQK